MAGRYLLTVLVLALLAPALCQQLTCNECTNLMTIFDNIITPTTPLEDIIAVGSVFCIAASIEPPDVCAGILNEFASYFRFVFSQRPAEASVCADLRYCTPIGEQPEEPITSAYAFREILFRKRARAMPAADKTTWSSDRKITPLTALKKLEDPSIGYMFHISDLHFDPDYAVGSQVDCGYPLCCHGGSGSAGPFGMYGCDTPFALAQSAFAAMAKALPDPDYIMFTGDVPPHNVWNQSIPYNMNQSVTTSALLSKYFPNTNVLYALGNHELFPVDQDPGPGNNTWYTGGLHPLWLSWLPQEDLGTWNSSAYYTVCSVMKLRLFALQTLLSPGVRVISLDTNYMLRFKCQIDAAPAELMADYQNFVLLLTSVNDMYQDLGNQLQWLNATLAAAQAAGEKVWLLGHIPLGDYVCLDSYADAMYAILSSYPVELYAAAFMGHTHLDQFRVFRYNDTQQTPFLPIYIAPAVTPENGNNPTFRIYEFNRTTGEILDYTQYIGNLSAVTTDGPTWGILYSARKDLGLPDLSAESWADYGDYITKNSTAMAEYCNYWYTGRGAEQGCGPSMGVQICTNVSQMEACTRRGAN